MVTRAGREETSASALVQLTLTLGFILTGTVTTLSGPLLPDFTQRWGLSDARAGQFFVSQFLSSTVGALVSDSVARRFGRKATIVIGFLFLTAGLCALTVDSAAIALIAVGVYGAGTGLTIPAINLTMADFREEAAASALNILNMLWTAGALASPVLVSFALRHDQLRTVLLALAGISAVVAMALMAMRIPDGLLRAADNAERAFGARSGSSALWLLFAFVFFLYVGLENAIAGWAAAYAQRTGVTQSIAAAALVPAAFWIALLSGRALFSALMLRTITPRVAASVGISMCLVGCALLLLASAPAVLIAGVFFAGFGLAPVFPNAIAQAKTLLAGRNIAALFACAGAGGAVVPYLVGVASSHTSQLGSGIRFTFVICVILAALQFRLARLPQRA